MKHSIQTWPLFIFVCPSSGIGLLKGSLKEIMIKHLIPQLYKQFTFQIRAVQFLYKLCALTSDMLQEFVREIQNIL